MTQRLTRVAARSLFISLLIFTASVSWSQICPDSIGLTITPVDVAKGDEICIDMSVDNFDSIETLQFSLRWDPTVLEYVRVEPINLRYLRTSNFGVQNAENGLMRFFWYDEDGIDGETLADGTVIFRLCFKAVGNPGDSTAIVISDDPLPFEASSVDIDDLCLRNNNADRVINITLPSMLCVIANSCSTEGSDGVVTVTVWGGQPPYVYNGISMNGVLNNQGESVTWTGLAPGSYSILVTDNSGADTTLNIQIADAPAIVLDSIEQINPSCDGSTPGSLEIAVSGGAPPYTISWSPINEYNVTRVTGLNQGLYRVTVKDSFGCTSVREFELVAGDVDVDVQVLTNASCFGVDDGQIRVEVTGGTTPYEFSATGNTYFPFPGTGITLSNQQGGANSLYIRDAQGCIRLINYNIPVDKTLTATSNVSDPLCFGEETGSIRIEGRTNGTPLGPYSFLLSDVNNNLIVGGINQGSSYSSPGLGAGTYYVTLEDNDGCLYLDTFMINQPPPLQGRLIDMDTIESCTPGSDAFLEVEAFGGTGPNYSYRWLIPGTTGPRITGLSAGLQPVEIRDSNGCLDTLIFTVTSAEPPLITGFDSVSVSCSGINDGSLTVLFTEGSAPVNSFNWNNGATMATASPIGPGNYCVTITDEKGCEAIECADLGDPMTGVNIDSVVLEEPVCFGEKGNIAVFVSGGQAPYTYTWSTGDVLVDRPVYAGVDAGIYYVTITDDGNCGETIDTIELTQPKELVLELLAVDTVSCSGNCDGRAGIGLRGGPDSTSGYIVSWSNGIMDTITDGLPAVSFSLCAGENYIVAVNELCGSDTLFFDIPEPDPIRINTQLSVVNPPSCYGLQDGSVTITAEGGQGTNYNYMWIPSGTTGPTLNNIGKDTLYVEITDERGCTDIDSIFIPEPDSISGFVVPSGTSDVTCFGDTDGRITVNWNGGNPGPATYDWSPNITSDSIATGLAPGVYSITITDVNGCSNVLIHEIIEPDSLSADIPEPMPISCSGDRTEIIVLGASGGNGGDFYYTINNGARLEIGEGLDVLAGNYDISVFDRLGCRFDTSLTIQQPAPISVGILQAPEVRVNLGESVELVGTVQAQSRIISVEWAPSDELSDPDSLITTVTPSRNETYTLTVFDENGCTASATVRVIIDAIRRVFIPNAFTPNDDGLNDVFGISTGAGVELIEVFEIYNRWGDLVYNISSPMPPDDINNFGWDGTWGGKVLEPGVFAYNISVRFIDGTVIFYQGDVTLLR